MNDPKAYYEHQRTLRHNRRVHRLTLKWDHCDVRQEREVHIDFTAELLADVGDQVALIAALAGKLSCELAKKYGERT